MSTSLVEKKLTIDTKSTLHYIIMIAIMAVFHLIPGIGM